SVAEEWPGRIIPIIGDLRKDRLGLPVDQFERLSHDVSAIYHSGADVNFVRSYHSLKGSTVGGTTEILRFAVHGHIKVLHHISSLAVFASAVNTQKAILREDDPLEDTRGLAVGYFQSKWVAEKLVESARTRGIPVAIYRPGQISGDSRTGEGKLDDLL